MARKIKTTYDIVLDKTNEGALVCNIMYLGTVPPISLGTFRARPVGRNLYHVFGEIPDVARKDYDFIEGESVASSMIVSLAQQHAIRLINGSSGGRR